mgnify:CR=1 FL=1
MSDGEGTHYTVDICSGSGTYLYGVLAPSSKAAFTKAITRWLEEAPSDYFIGRLDIDVHETSDDDEVSTGGEGA